MEDGEIKSVTAVGSEIDGWTNFGDDDIMQQQYTIQSEEAKKVPFVVVGVSLDGVIRA